MNKVIVALHVPAIYEEFDVFLPTDVPIRELKTIITGGIAELTNAKYIVSGSEQLCRFEPSGLLNPELTLQDYGIKDGTLLYLI